MLRTGNLKNWSSALIALLIGGLLTTTSAPALAVTPGAAGCELTGVKGPSSAGTSSNPYRVSTPDELAEVVDCDTGTSKYFQMTNDIDLAGLAWKPIGAGALPNDNASSPFKGHFDGAGNTITNLVTSDGYSGGLFGALEGNSGSDMSSVKNLRIQGSVYSGVFGLTNRSASFSNITLNVDVTRNSNAPSRTKIATFAPDGFLVHASSISVQAGGAFGLKGLIGDSSVTHIGGLYSSLDNSLGEATPNRLSNVKVSTFVGAVKPSADLAGLITYVRDDTEILNSRVSVTLESLQAGTSYMLPDVGGMVSGAASGSLLTVSNSVVNALIVLPYSSYSPYIDGSFGGFMGTGQAHLQSVSAIVHAHVPPNIRFGNNGFIGGLFGAAQGTSSIDDSYASLSLTHEGSDISHLDIGGLVGYLGSGASLSGDRNLFNGSASSEVLAAVDDTSAGTSTLTATMLSLDQIVPATFIGAGWDMAASSTSFDSTTGWNICEHPFPTSIGEEQCGPIFLGGKVARNGLGVELFFGSPIDTSILPGQANFEIQANSTQVPIEAPTASSFGASNSIAISFSNQAEFDSSVLILGSYDKPQSGPALESLSGREISSFPLTRFANSSLLLPPTGSISLVSNGTTTASLQVLCTADCGGGANFTYSIAIEKTGTGVVDVTSNDSGLITGLQPSTSYTAEATVTFNGRTSTQVSVAFNTQRPEATISAVTLNGQEVTGVISCTNCGADPTTISFMATPTAGGASISSSSTVLSGLATATSYSVSVRVTFMGAESLEVTWSSTILTAADPMPVITTINPASVLTSGGTEVTVMGTNFTGASISVDGIAVSSVTIVSGTELNFISPAGSTGNSIVRVTNAGGFDEVTLVYTAPPAPSTPGSAPPVVINTPTITEFSTREISASGAEVTATGQRLENVSVLSLGGITVTIVSNTATSITFTTGEMPVGVWDLRLVGSNGTLVFQQAIEVVEATAIVAESTGELLGYTWTFKFLGNSRSLHSAQREHLTGKLDQHSTAETIICWGYTTAENPNAWAIAHATQRAQAACDLASANNSEVKTVVRLRYGVSKNWAMRSALQFWR